MPHRTGLERNPFLTSPPHVGEGTVLVVDDTDAHRYAVSRALRSEGFTVLEADCAAGALEQVGSQDLDAVVLDVNLPDMNGFDLCREIKRRRANLPIMHLSARESSAEGRARGLEAGAESYMAHPFDPNALRATVRGMVRCRRQETVRAVAAEIGTLLIDALDALADHVALLGPTGHVVAVNRAWATFAQENGYANGATGVGVSYPEVCERADSLDAAQGIRAVLKGTLDSYDFDYPCHSPTTERWYRMTARPVQAGGAVAAIVTHRNRTDEVVATRTAESDRRLLMATLDALPVGVWLADAHGAFTHTNPAAARIWGGQAPMATEVEGYAIYSGRRNGVPVGPHDWPLARVIAAGAPVLDDLVEIDRFDGTTGHSLFSAAPIRSDAGEMVGALVVGTDVTDRTEASAERERLLRSLDTERGRLETIFQEASSFLAIGDGPNHTFRRVNPAYMALVGPHRDIVGRTVAECMPEAVEQGLAAALDHVLATGEPFYGHEVPILLNRTPDGPPETRYVDFVYRRIQEADGQFSMMTHGMDVTDQVRANQALQLSERRAREQFEKLPVATVLWERDGDDFRLIDYNEAALSFVITPESIGRTSSEIFPDHPELQEDRRRCLRDDIVVRRNTQYTRNGGTRYLELTMGPQQPNRVLTHVVDTTDRVELESQLRQAQKMEAVGQLAGGVAHDFNNILTVISAHSGFLVEEPEASPQMREDAVAIRDAATRAAGLTRQLLAFSRKQILKPIPLDVNAVILDTSSMLKRLLNADIEVVMSLESDLGLICADVTQVEQVLVNLAVNARDAMSEGGVLTISTRTVVADDGTGPRIVLEVADTGVGMDLDTQARVFEPFFTTKGAGRGTGLGLSTVYGIVEQSGGTVSVESLPGVGTCFRISLPMLETCAPDLVLTAVQDAGVAGGSETVLLIEDEAAVRSVTTRLLERQGYRVLQAESGAAGVAVARDYPGRIHIVVSDLVMPGMGGVEAVERIRASRPDVCVLFMSGHTDDEVARRGIIAATMPFIQKPFTLRQFASTVRSTLDSIVPNAT